jgi:hypothetical protein
MPKLEIDTINDVLPTVLHQNLDGSVEYPGRVPPSVDFPVTSPKDTPQAPLKTTSAAIGTTLLPIEEKCRPTNLPGELPN